MTKKMLVILICLILLTVPVLAAPAAPAIDSTPDKALLLNMDQWLAANPVKAGEKPKIEKIFESPRSAMFFINSNGLVLPKHFHTSADELVVIYRGKGEMLIDGKWVPFKAGDVHVNPRGAVHATRCAPGQQLSIVSIFTPPQAGGNDRVSVE